jgi:hypothetical protein
MAHGDLEWVVGRLAASYRGAVEQDGPEDSTATKSSSVGYAASNVERCGKGSQGLPARKPKHAYRLLRGESNG